MTTTNISPLQAGAGAVTRALKEASDRTGVGFDVLYNIAKRESSFDPNARAKTSSAAGLFQFIEQTWLGAVKNYGARHGLGEEASAITQRADGRFVVSDADKRKDILDLRFDPDKAARLAGELAQDNAGKLERRLGRAVERVEIYAAHFLGVAGAARLLSAPSEAKAADLLPAAAKANRPVFFDKGVAKSVAEVVASIAKSMNAATPEAPARPAATAAPSVGELRFDHLFASVQPSAPNAFRLLSDAPERPASELTPFAVSVLQALDPTRLDPREKDRRV